MTKDPSDPSLEQDMLAVLRDFCRRLNDRLERFATPMNASVFPGGVGTPTMVHVFDANIRLNKEMLGQKPHRFIGRYLVEPSLEQLGYQYIPEPRGGLVEEKDIYPDFRLVPINEASDRLFIGELKNPGGIAGGVNQLKKEYLMELSPGTLGIATDGIRWKLYQRSSNSVEKVRPHETSLRKVLHEIRQPMVHTQMKPKSDEKLSSRVEKFVEMFEYPIEPQNP